MRYTVTRHPVRALTAAVILVLMTATVWQIWDIRNELDNTKQENVALSEVQGLSAQQAALLAQQVEDLGARPVVDPEDLENYLESNPPIKGDPGRAPSEAEVAQAVSNYCSGGICDGKNPSAAQVAAAVATYCNSKGECEGPEGAKGETGQAGSNGQQGTSGAQGDPGPPPSDAQVLEAVNTYCGNHNECRGPAGADGRSVVSVTCDTSTEEFVVRYSDETSEAVSGSDCVADDPVIIDP